MNDKKKIQQLLNKGTIHAIDQAITILNKIDGMDDDWKNSIRLNSGRFNRAREEYRDRRIYRQDFEVEVQNTIAALSNLTNELPNDEEPDSIIKAGDSHTENVTQINDNELNIDNKKNINTQESTNNTVGNDNFVDNMVWVLGGLFITVAFFLLIPTKKNAPVNPTNPQPAKPIKESDSTIKATTTRTIGKTGSRLPASPIKVNPLNTPSSIIDSSHKTREPSKQYFITYKITEVINEGTKDPVIESILKNLTIAKKSTSHKEHNLKATYYFTSFLKIKIFERDTVIIERDCTKENLENTIKTAIMMHNSENYE